MNYKLKYLKYKIKYLELKNLYGGIYDYAGFITNCKKNNGNKLDNKKYDFWRLYPNTEIINEPFLVSYTDKKDDVTIPNKANYICDLVKGNGDYKIRNGGEYLYDIWESLSYQQKEEIVNILFPDYLNFKFNTEKEFEKKVSAFNEDADSLEIEKKTKEIILQVYNDILKILEKKKFIIREQMEELLQISCIKMLIYYNIKDNINNQIRAQYIFNKIKYYLLDLLQKWNKYNFQRWETGGAGHCFYYSFLSGLRHIKYNPKYLRENCKKLKSENYDEIYKFINKYITNDSKDQITFDSITIFKKILENYIRDYVNKEKEFNINLNENKLVDKISKLCIGTEWAENEIIDMCCKLFRVRIILYTDYNYNFPEKQKVAIIDSEPYTVFWGESRYTICIYNTPGVHYQYLIPEIKNFTITPLDKILKNTSNQGKKTIEIREKYYNKLKETYNIYKN